MRSAGAGRWLNRSIFPHYAHRHTVMRCHSAIHDTECFYYYHYSSLTILLCKYLTARHQRLYLAIFMPAQRTHYMSEVWHSATHSSHEAWTSVHSRNVRYLVALRPSFTEVDIYIGGLDFDTDADFKIFLKCREFINTRRGYFKTLHIATVGKWSDM